MARLPSGKYSVFGTLIRHKAGSFLDTLIVQLGLAMLLTLWWSLSHQLLSIKLPLVHLRMGKRHACTLYADRSLNDIKPRASANNPLHESEVTAWHGLRGPQPDNQVLHG